MADTQRKIVGRAGILLIPYVQGVDFDASQAQHAGQQVGAAVQQGVNHGVNQGGGPGHAITQNVQHAPAQSAGRAFMKRLGTGIVAGVAALGLGKLLVDGVKTASSRADSAKTLQASLGLTDAESKKAGKIAGDLYSQAYGDSFEEVQGAIEAVASSMGGFSKVSQSELTKISKYALNFSSLFGVDAADSVSLVQELVKNGLVKDATQGFDYLTKSFQKVPVAVRQDVIDGLREYTPYFAQLGYTGDETFNSIVNSAGNGAIAIDKSLDAIKEFGIRSTDMSASSVAAYKAIGLNATETAAAFNNGGQGARNALTAVAAALLKIPDKTKRANTAISLFGTQLEDLGTNKNGLEDYLKTLTGYRQTLGDVTGTSEKVNKQVGSTNESMLKGLKATFEQTLGEIAIPLLQALVPILKDISSFVSENKEQIKQWAGPILIVGGAIAALVAVFAIVGPIIEVVTGLMTIFGVTSLAALGPILLPILAVIAAVAALIAIVVLIVQNWAPISKFFGDLLGGIGGFFADLGKNIVQIFSNVLSFFGDLLHNIGQFFVDLGKNIANFFIGIFNGVNSFIVGGVNTVINVINGMLSFVFGGLQQLSSAISSLTGGLINFGFSVPQLPTLSYTPVPQLATGGLIPARRGGTAAILGENGKDEVVLNRDSFNKQANSNAQLNAAVVKSLQDGASGSGGNQTNYIDATSMNPYQLDATLRMRHNITKLR